MIAALLLAVLPATFNGTTWQDAAPCNDLAFDLTYSVCAVVVVPPGTTGGRTAYAAVSSTSSYSYFELGTDPAGWPKATHRSGSSSFFNAPGAYLIADGQPHTLFAVADGTVLRLYVDGVAAGSVSLAGASQGPRELCTVGALRRSSGITAYWQGEVRSLRTWNRAATSDEIAAGCGAPTTPVLWPCSGHVGLVWDYTDGPTPADWFELDRQVTGTPESWQPIGQTNTLNQPPVWEYQANVCPPGQPCEIQSFACNQGQGGCPCPSEPSCTLIRSAVRVLEWPILRGSKIPLEGVIYDYRVRAVAGAQRSEWSEPFVCLPAAGPTRCYAGGAQVACP